MATKDISDTQVCQAFSDALAVKHKVRAQQLLIDRTGQPAKVCWRAMERAEGRGLLEYGVSLAVAWLTQKGKDMLK